MSMLKSEMDTATPLEKANAMSDHAAQVNPSASVVSQNLQGPYAIKMERNFWVLDWPKGSLRIDKGLRGQNDKFNQVITDLVQITGLKEKECRLLLNAIIDDNSKSAEQRGKIAKAVPRYKKSSESSSVFKTLATLTNKGIGDTLGEGGFRICIESDTAFQFRMQKQVAYLKASIDSPGGAQVLCFQEQPYRLPHDKSRQALFNEVMSQAGYIEVAALDKRDIGIWVKKELKAQFRAVSDAKLVDLIERDPHRGCVIQGKNALYINLHSYTRHIDQDSYVQGLCDLKKMAEGYAGNFNPPLQVCINGDLNLFKLSIENRQRLEKAGFQIDAVKGQEKFPTPTCEAYSIGNPIGSNALTLTNDLQTAVYTAYINYTRYHNEGENPAFNRGQGDGFFSHLRHGAKGLANAQNLCKSVENLTSYQVVQKLRAFLADSSRKYHHHSFASYLADELAQRKIIAGNTQGRYEQKDVVGGLDKWLLTKKDDDLEQPLKIEF
ncbi:hypothetical protein [Legionella taurinensis]|uniref:hypothetical protein n=1 Tax=Legionella taurinensis TaxID=70611 RepID=UPI00299D6705|nr:hypothetical protein [Legionella taurinensis]MDX1837287.1 hypothetical protein [Legionella taurinensis]